MAERKIRYRIFSKGKYDNNVEMRYVDRDFKQHSKYLTDREYERYSALANSGKYFVGIESLDYGVAWTLSR